MATRDKIKIYTRSANIELYRYSQGLIDLPYKRVRLYGTTADGYFYQMLEDKECDWVVNVDEDAFVMDNVALQSLLDYVIENDIVCCGMHDGGVLPIRFCNPIILNPFFNIINLKTIREKFNREEIEHFDYAAHEEELKMLLPDYLKDYEGLKYADYEPYYHFFFWLAQNFKLMYLEVEEHKDGCTTIVYNQEHKPILLHTWWSREYGKDETHTPRIKAIIDEAYTTQGKKKPFMFLTKIMRWFENKSQEFAIWWDWWTKLGFGNYIIRHLKKSPKHYVRRINEKIIERCHH